MVSPAPFRVFASGKLRRLGRGEGMTCPKCGSTFVVRERKLNGLTKCNACNFFAVHEVWNNLREDVAHCQCGGDRIKVKEVDGWCMVMCCKCYKACTRDTRQEAVTRWNEHTAKLSTGRWLDLAESGRMSNKLGENMIGKYCVVRTYSAGVHAGILVSRDEKEVVLKDSRRIWYWAGAASLSELAVRGTSKPDECKFPCAVEEILLTEAIEIIPCTETARQSILGVPVWGQ